MKVLVIEDEQRIARALRTGLEAEGLAVELAFDGVTGLSRAMDDEFDAIILDCMLPGMNGYRVCTSLRDADIRTPILMLTAKDGEYDEAEALDSGADDYLRKPFSYVVLLARLRSLLRRSPDPRVPPVTVGDLVLDPSRRTCTRDRTPVSLTSKEFTILLLLAQRAGQPVSKRELLSDCWDFAYSGDVNVVEVHISAIRRKIDVPFGRSSIRTVRGRGYRLINDVGAPA